MTAEDVIVELKAKGNPQRAKLSLRYFKTGKGQYGEGDKFFGVNLPDTRGIVRKYRDLSFLDIQKLLNNEFHDTRTVAVLILVEKFSRGDAKEKEKTANFYLKNTKRINNWDLVDISAPKVLGPYFLDKEKDVLYKLSKSTNLWERRISIMSTFWFIKKGEYKDSLKIAENLLKDKEDLIHKAVGWMLREIGKKDLKTEEEFLEKYYREMPRTMLRYSIEKFDKDKREYYMKK